MILLVYLAVSLLGVSIFSFILFKSPFGYEDQKGFHFNDKNEIKIIKKKISKVA